MRKFLAALVIVAVIGVVAVVAAGDAGCLSNDYLSLGGHQIEAAFDTLPDAVGAEIAKEKALENAPEAKADNIIGTKLVRLNDEARGSRNVYLVGFATEPQRIIGSDLMADSTCKVSVVDAKTGEWLYDYEVLVPDPDALASAGGIPTLR